jgi:hypothetical protein
VYSCSPYEKEGHQTGKKLITVEQLVCELNYDTLTAAEKSFGR